MVDVGPVNSISPIQNTSSGAPSSAFEHSKPVLVRMLSVHRNLGKMGDQASHHYLDRIETERSEIKRVSKEQMDHLIAVANRSWMEHAWSALKTVADCVVSVVSFAMGGYLLANGNASSGNAVIAFGIFNILQTVFARQGMWDWISRTLQEQNESYRERLKMAFPIIVSMLSIGFSIASSRTMSALGPNDLLKRLETLQTAISIGGQGVNSYMSIRKGIDQANLAGIQADLKIHEQTSDLLTRLLDYMMKETRRVKSAIKKPINSLMQATTLASQKV